MRVSETQLIRSLCRDSYRDFIKEFWSETSRETLRWNWHMDVIADDLQRMAHRVFAGLPKEHDELINISPGTSKSTLCSILFIPWVWTFMPHAQFIMASHSSDLALELSSKCRDVVKSAKYQACFPEVKIRPDQDSKSFFKNTAGGYRIAVGAGSTIIGFHGHFIIIDDPIDPTAALSDAVLHSTNHWIKQTLRSRKVNKLVTVTVLIMQRLHQNDPAGQMVQRRNIRHLRIPAEDVYPVHPPELKEKYIDGLMDPVGLPREFLEEEKQPTAMGEYGYAGQYGQNPVPAGGGMFKTDRLRHGRRPDRFEGLLVRYWDKAATEGKESAFTVGVRGGFDARGCLWILGVARFRRDSHRRERLIEAFARRDGRGTVVGVEEEAGSGGKESAEGTMRRLARQGFRVRSLRPRGEKSVRADELSQLVNGGLVYLPEEVWGGAGWTGWAADFVEEMTYFPLSTYKDQIDAAAGMLSCLTRKRRRVGGMRKRRQEYEQKRRQAVSERRRLDKAFPDD